MLDILTTLKTKSNSVLALNTLETALQDTYKKTKSKVDLKGLGIKVSTKDSLVEVINTNITHIKNADVLDITSSIPLEDSFVDKLYTWFSANGAKNFLFNISVDGSICGGLTVAHQGKYYDLSLKKKVYDYVQHKHIL